MQKSTYVVYFAIWEHLSYIKHRNTCKGKLILVMQLLWSLWAPHPMKIWFKFFPSLTIFLHAKTKCDLVIPSEGICNQTALQSNWLKAFLAIIQKQEFPQIWYLFSKIDNKFNFYLSWFQQKPMTKFFKINKKTHFGVILEHILSFFPKGNFS